MLYRFLRPLLFRLDAERAHRLATAALRFAQGAPGGRGLLTLGHHPSPRLARHVGDLTLRTPIGLAAGFDKDAHLIHAMAALGAGSVEVGTVTPRPQPGNPTPRLFRYPEQRSLQNRLGFNNAGLEAAEQRLSSSRPYPLTVGVNVGRNKTTPNEAAADDYLVQIERLGELADYLVVNVSSPNTPGLRDLQQERPLRALLERATQLTRRPVLVKIAPDMDPGHAADLADAVLAAGAAGLVATNTTTDTSAVPAARDEGGLSGAVLKDKSREFLTLLAPVVHGRGILISVGGISSADDAYERLRAGADWVQLYSALVFQGPRLFASWNRRLLERLDADGAACIDDIVAADLDAAS